MANSDGPGRLRSTAPTSFRSGQQSRVTIVSDIIELRSSLLAGAESCTRQYMSFSGIRVRRILHQGSNRKHQREFLRKFVLTSTLPVHLVRDIWLD
jgi:hypothetical protein